MKFLIPRGARKGLLMTIVEFDAGDHIALAREGQAVTEWQLVPPPGGARMTFTVPAGGAEYVILRDAADPEWIWWGEVDGVRGPFDAGWTVHLDAPPPPVTDPRYLVIGPSGRVAR